jgi:hypothetical protein
MAVDTALGPGLVVVILVGLAKDGEPEASGCACLVALRLTRLAAARQIDLPVMPAQ